MKKYIIAGVVYRKWLIHYIDGQENNLIFADNRTLINPRR